MMKTIIFISILPLLSSCSIFGAMLGSAVDDSVLGDDENKSKYESEYMVEGLQEDVAFIKAILSSDEKEVVDNRPCKAPETIQECTVNKGCWCEKI
jgi:hypothetical protein